MLEKTAFGFAGRMDRKAKAPCAYFGFPPRKVITYLWVSPPEAMIPEAMGIVDVAVLGRT